MRKLTLAALAGLTVLGAAAPAMAQNPYGDRDRDGVPNGVDRHPNNGPRGDRDHDGVPNAYDRHPNGGGPRGDRDHDGVPNRYDHNVNGRPYGDHDRDGIPNRYDRNDYSRGFGYRSGWNYNDRWTPYGWGYNDPATRRWVIRYYGGLNDRNWRRAQVDFYRFADTNRDGTIERWEYDRAMRNIYGFRR